MDHHHFLLISLHGQGHVNPTLELAKKLTRTGARVTFATSIYGRNSKIKLPTYEGLSYAYFSNGFDEESRKKANGSTFMEDVKRMGSESLKELFKNLSEGGHPITFLIYTVMLPWAAAVAREMDVPSAFYAFQCATNFAVIHRFFRSPDGVCYSTEGDATKIFIDLADLPVFSHRDLPTYLVPTEMFSNSAKPFIQDHIKALEQDSKACVLVNSFLELEEKSIRAIDNMKVIPIGPLIPSADISVDSSKQDYLKWLDSKPEKSVIYVAFGSIVVLKKEQKAEILRGLVDSGKPFIWIIRSSDDELDEVMAIIEKGLTGDGIILPWCSQVEVLNHPSIGCFVSHCGWNSTLESLTAGMPMVGYPQIYDQPTNAKMIEEVWGIGVRTRPDENGVLKGEELRRCLDILMGGGERGEEIRKNAAKWSCLAMEAVKENGSSSNNLKMFLATLE